MASSGFKNSISRGKAPLNIKEIERHDSNSVRYASHNSQLFKYSDARNRKELAKIVAVENLSFSFGEKLGFLNYCHTALNPDACRVPRNIVIRTMFDIYKKEKRALVKYFKNYGGRVSVCTDIWYDHWQQHAYLAVTCHFINDAWVMQKRILAFRVFDDFIADNIYKLMKIIFEEYSIENKIFTIGFDNVVNNNVVVPQLYALCNRYFDGRLFYQKCAYHVLNLCVQNGLEILQENIKPIMDALYYLWKHPSTMKRWTRFCISHRKHPIRFSCDVPTRWKSTYKLLCESYEYRELLIRFMQYNISSINLYPQHWDVCIKICELLKLFNDATNTLSGIYYPNIHLFFIEALNIVGAFSQCANDQLLADCVKVMKSTWLNYYKDIPIIYAIALCFDPRCKLDNLLECYTMYYECLGIDDVDLVSIFNNVKTLFYQLYDEYLGVYGPSLNITVQKPQKDSQSKVPTTFKKLGSTLLSKQTSTSEIDVYLKTAFEFVENVDFDIQEWWRDHEKIFPILAIIAKQILGTPVSTVAVEQEFNTGRNVLDERRSLLSPDLIEAQVCVEDWTKAQMREQEMDQPSDDNDFFDNDETTSTEGTSDDS
ncbi:hypothetical protein ACOSQ4_005919 [Xanthoceras sorbifolium]